jgi:phosphomannomutase/phosphoglucomutase
MARIFIILSSLALAAVILSGGLTYWLSVSEIKQAQAEQVKTLAQGLAIATSERVGILQKTVDNAAKLPDVAEALANRDTDLILFNEETLKTLIPYSLEIRLLFPDVNDIDESRTPAMGFADLEMVQETLTAPQKPTIQGQGQHRHLAITSLVNQDNRPVGVILASLRYDFLNDLSRQLPITSGRIEIRQGHLSLTTLGSEANKQDPDYSVAIPGTDWKVVSWTPNDTAESFSLLVLAAILVTGLLACLAFFIGYRKLVEYLQLDQSTIIKAARDFLSGKLSGNYPIILEEMNPIITTLAQYKRALDHEETDLDQLTLDDNDLGDDFFDEGLDTGFLDHRIEVEEAPKKEAFFESSAPIQLNTNTPNIPFSKTQSIDHIFRAYDIRGIADEELTTDMAYKIGQAIGSEAKQKHIKTIVLGRDGRNSSRKLAASLQEGILSTGRNILDIGLVPTPVLYFVAHHTEGRSGVMITGSHNPPEYNGIKIVLNGETLAQDKIQLLKHRIDDNDLETGERGSVDENTRFSNEYIGIISDDIHIARPMKVVLDCGNGAAGELAPILLRTMGCEVIELFCEIDGSFPNHHPDPSKPENLQDLIAMVKHHEADVGIALDGDGDRLGIIDSAGKIIWPDRQMMLFAKDILSNMPGAEIIFDVKCSRHLTDVINKYGGRPLMWKTGHSLLKAKLKETGAVLAGEMSGHIFFNDRWFGFDDGLYAASRMIELLSTDTRPSQEVFADFPDSVNTPEITIDLPEGEHRHVIEQLFAEANFPDGNILSIDGLRVDFEDGWGLVRASNTTPSLVLRFEADNEEALARIQAQFRALLLKVKPDLKIPF